MQSQEAGMKRNWRNTGKETEQILGSALLDWSQLANKCSQLLSLARCLQRGWRNYYISEKSIQGSRRLSPASSPLPQGGSLLTSERLTRPLQVAAGDASPWRTHWPVGRMHLCEAARTKGTAGRAAEAATSYRAVPSGQKATQVYLGEVCRPSRQNQGVLWKWNENTFQLPGTQPTINDSSSCLFLSQKDFKCLWRQILCTFLICTAFCKSGRSVNFCQLSACF